MITQKDILKKVRQVEIRTRRAVSDTLAGSYHSVFRGQGIDFEESREYYPGDDVRNIDWNVTARTGRPFVKVFREERELTMMLAVDLSASQGFGGVDRSKREVAAELAAILAFSAIRNNDKAGLLLFTDKVERYIAPRKGVQHVLRVVREILFHEPESKGTNRAAAFDYINHVLTRRAVVFFLSDFSSGKVIEKTSIEARLMAVTAARHDLVVANICDTSDYQMPAVGTVLFEDPETGLRSEVNTSSESFRRYYQKLGQEAHQGWERLARQSGAGYLTISSEKEILRELRLFMERRALAR